ncbi:MAG: hypothetical protein ACI88Z_000865, partial [Sphingobacteriales bacterium]
FINYCIKTQTLKHFLLIFFISLPGTLFAQNEQSSLFPDSSAEWVSG